MTNDENVFFTLIDDQEDIRQGDIVCRKTSNEADAAEYGLIANADCDVAQKKNAKTFTWLKVVSLNQYYREHWAPDRASKMLDKYGSGILNTVNAQIRRLDSGLLPLNEGQLFSWISESGFETVSTALNSPEHPVSQDLQGKLRAVDLLLSRDHQPLGVDRITEASALLQISPETIRSEMEKALSNAGGFPDYFVLPELPATAGIGYVVLLRGMSIVQAGDVYKTELEARIADAPNAFYRLGRLSDRVRYGVLQKLGFLFMRIGDHPLFETACKTSYTIAIDEIVRTTP